MIIQILRYAVVIVVSVITSVIASALTYRKRKKQLYYDLVQVQSMVHDLPGSELKREILARLVKIDGDI